MHKFAKGHNSRKLSWNSSKSWSGNLLIIPYQLIKFQAPSLNNFFRYEPAHEIMALFFPRKLILQTRMHSHQVGLDVWLLVSPFVYIHSSCVRTAKALARLRITPEREITQTRNKIEVNFNFFFMRNPYMKFQNPRHVWFIRHGTHQKAWQTTLEQYAPPPHPTPHHHQIQTVYTKYEHCTVTFCE